MRGSEPHFSCVRTAWWLLEGRGGCGLAWLGWADFGLQQRAGADVPPLPLAMLAAGAPPRLQPIVGELGCVALGAAGGKNIPSGPLPGYLSQLCPALRPSLTLFCHCVWGQGGICLQMILGFLPTHSNCQNLMAEKALGWILSQSGHRGVRQESQHLVQGIRASR